MEHMITISLFFALLSFQSFAAHADEIAYSCDGVYNSNQAADTMEPSTISVRAHLEAVMMGDTNAQGEYTMAQMKLSLVATNLGNADAGSFDIQKPLVGKLNRAHSQKYKDYIKFDLGSNLGQAYENNADAPETYLLIPESDSNVVYVQRSGSGHDVYPTITLKCRN